MNASDSAISGRWVIVGIVVMGAVALVASLNWPRGDALAAALQPLIKKQGSEKSLVAQTILDNYRETRSDASRWSAVYWGCTFVAATFSALAGLILKFESIVRNGELKKDAAALLSVGAALLIAISTSGDFQRKWQANRVAASELERTGYALLADKTADPAQYFTALGNILHKRNLAVVGNLEQPKTLMEPPNRLSQEESK